MKTPKVIVSLTTHSIRLKIVGKVIYHILQSTFKELKVVLTLYKDDVKNIPKDLKTMIDSGLVELIVADIDLGPHLKYFYSMQKYRELPVITIDDDVYYPHDMVEKLYKAHKENPNCVIGRRCFDIEAKDGKLTSYNNWILEYTKKDYPTHSIFATGIGGVLYPKNCFKLNSNYIDDILTIKYDDDFYLKALEVRNNLKVKTIIFSPEDVYFKNLNDKWTQSISLWNNKNHKDSNLNILKFESEFLYASQN